MSAQRVSRLRWPAWLRQLGWPGLLGAGLLLACAYSRDFRLSPGQLLNSAPVGVF